MAEIKTIHATYGRKWNLDDYESATVSLDAFADLADGEDPNEATEQLFAFLKETVAAQSVPMLVKRDERRRLRVQEVLDGLPERLRELAESFIQSVRNDVPQDRVVPEIDRVTADVARGRVRRTTRERGEPDGDRSDLAAD